MDSYGDGIGRMCINGKLFMGGIFVLKFCVEYVFFYLVNDYFFDCFLESGNGVF